MTSPQPPVNPLPPTATNPHPIDPSLPSQGSRLPNPPPAQPLNNHAPPKEARIIGNRINRSTNMAARETLRDHKVMPYQYAGLAA